MTCAHGRGAGDIVCPQCMLERLDRIADGIEALVIVGRIQAEMAVRESLFDRSMTVDRSNTIADTLHALDQKYPMPKVPK